jgi:hypothetical protein
MELRRADLIAVCDALSRAQPQVAVETAAAKRAWRLVANGLSSAVFPAAREQVQTAAAAAAAVAAPAPLSETQAKTLTGPAAQLAGLFRAYTVLSSRGWQMVAAAITEIQQGPPAAARFARENAALYIDSVYDAHFSLAQVERKLRAGYRELGGERAFGRALSPQLIEALAHAYSERSERLHPHVGVRFGS